MRAGIIFRTNVVEMTNLVLNKIAVDVYLETCSQQPVMNISILES